MPRAKLLAAVVLGRSPNPERGDAHYYFCTCTPCYNGPAVAGLGRRGKWQPPLNWNHHRRRAEEEGRDQARFAATLLVGHVPRAARVAVKEDSDAEPGLAETSEGTMEDDDSWGVGGSDVEMMDVEEQRGSQDSSSNLGGHDEFMYGSDDQEVGGTGSAVEGDEDGTDDEASFSETNDAASQSDGGYDPSEASDDSSPDENKAAGSEDEKIGEADSDYDDDSVVAYSRQELAPGDFACEDGEEADNAEADYNHHLPDSDDDVVVEPDEHSDADEDLAAMMANVELAKTAGAELPQTTPEPDWPDENNFGGGGDDFNSDSGGEGGDESEQHKEIRRRQALEALRSVSPEFNGGEARAIELPKEAHQAHEASPSPEAPDVEAPVEAPPQAAEPVVAGLKTAARAQRLPPQEFRPCAPPSRTLSYEDTVKLHYFEMAIDHSMGPKFIDRMNWFLKEIGVNVPGLDSFHSLRGHAHNISQPGLVYEDHCPGHTDSGNPNDKDWRFCEAQVRVKIGVKKWQWETCAKPRYFPLDTPNLKTLRKNSQKLGQQLPPIDKVPIAQHSHMSVGPFVDALYANPIHSADLLRANRESIEAARTDAEEITSFETAEMPRKLFHPVTGPCTEDDMLLSTTSDGADIYPDACPNQPVKAHVAAVRCSCLSSKSHDLCYVCGVNGPNKSPATLYLHNINADLVGLEQPKWRYHAAKGGMVYSRVFAALNCSDTVEQCDLSNTVGAAGRCPSMLHETRGCWNLLKRQWQHPLHNFARAMGTLGLGRYDARGDVWTCLDAPIGSDPDAEPAFKPVVRTLAAYEKTNKALDAARTQEERDRVRRRSGIKGRSIYGVLGIFPWVYPWMFALDDMHVTYSNNMKNFLVSMFGKSTEKETIRGTMVSPANHFRMAKELRRSIHLQPAAHGQKVRGIEHLNRLKAAETRSFLWFHLAPLFHGVFEKNQDMALVVAAIRSTRITNHRVVLRTAPLDKNFKTYLFDDHGCFKAPMANVIHAVDEFLIRRERLFVARNYKYGSTCVPSLIRSQALPDMVRLWGPGLLATTQWALEGKIGDLKRFAKSRALPVKNMENNNINRNMMVLIRLKYDFPKYDPVVSADLRHKHPILDSTTFLHKKDAKPTITPTEVTAIKSYLTEIGERMSDEATPVRWQRLQLSNDEIIGSMSRERGTELERIVVEEGAEDDEEEERLGRRRATRFCKYTLRPDPLVEEPVGYRDHQIFEVDSYMMIPLAPDSRPLFLALGRTFPSLVDRYRIHEAFAMGNGPDKRTFKAIGVEQIRHGVGLTIGLKQATEPEPMWWVTMSVAKATKYLMSQE
ncbi:hypothetical protein P7C70_g6960, partial [Phenoliferia sp. Uapishka_3]